MDQHVSDEIEIDLLELFHVLKRKLWIIVISGILFATGFGLVSSFALTPIYTSRTQLYILSKSTTLTSLADLQIGTQLTQDYMVLVKSRPVVEGVIEAVGLDMSYQGMLDIVTVSNPSNTRILEIKVEYPDPYIAKSIVDTFATVASERIASIMDSEKPTIVEEGHMSTIPSSPNIRRNTLIGGVLGLLFAAGIFVVIYLLDDSIKDAEDVSRYLGITTLGIIPVEPNEHKKVAMDKKRRKRAKKSVKKG